MRKILFLTQLSIQDVIFTHLLKRAPNISLPPFHFLIHFNQISILTAPLKWLLWTLTMVSKCQIVCPFLSLDPMWHFFGKEALSINMLIILCSFWPLLLCPFAGSTFVSTLDSGIPPAQLCLLTLHSCHVMHTSTAVLISVGIWLPGLSLTTLNC